MNFNKITDNYVVSDQINIDDISKIKEFLGWMPMVTFNNGLKKTIEDLQGKKGLKTIGY